MSETKQFHTGSKRIAFDERHRRTINFNISRYDAAVAKGIARYQDIEEARNRAASIKRNMLKDWDKYLIQFEENITKRGVKVLWAKDTVEATSYIKDILLENEARLLVKSKSMTTEEVEFNHVAAEVGCESVETDLGEFIVQVAGERPYHIVTPAMHKSKEDIAALFHKEFNTPESSTPEELTEYVRQVLRKKYTTADVGVTGANFLVADVGGISVTENEGNGVMTTAFPKVHIVLAGIEKIIPRMNQLGLFYPLLAAKGTGQQITAYNTIITAPRQGDEANGPEQMYVILLDNGRTTVYEDDDAYEALSCIRCGACLNGCPVYKTIGGYVYNTTYSGPIGSVLTPFFRGFKDFSHLSFASSLCGKCAEVCPVRIPLTDILLTNRRKAVENYHRPLVERGAMKGFRMISSKRIGFDVFPSGLKNVALYPFNFVGWGPKRSMPKFARKSFSQQYRKNKKN
ncbi:lactate utilization protein [Paludibacter sp. 221]|uniref:lactate utilization protein B n=1 Tax=Paludibacter sp. 221 TaxID=2302939 RepID=UPI0013D840FE|nr:lactate utilization protein B [Paludibacter sp. 221]NDV47699.1 lactate utilization protein [Paludibacter sp. 221]